MDSESKALAWVANIREQFNTFCSEADDIIHQEPIEYVRNQFLTAGDTLKDFYTELVKDALPLFSSSCLEEYGPTSPRKEENIRLLPPKISNISIDDEHKGRVSVTSSSSSLPTEPVSNNISEDFSSKEKGNNEMGSVVVENLEMDTSESSKTSILAAFSTPDWDGNNVGGLAIEEVDCDAHVNFANFPVIIEYPEEKNDPGNLPEAHFASKVDEHKLPDTEITSSVSVSVCSTEEVHSCGSSEHIHAGEGPDSYVTKLDGESTQPSEWQKLDNSLTPVDSDDSDDEFYSESEMEADHVSYQKTETPRLDTEFAKNRLFKTASESLDVETEVKEWEKLDEDVSDSDWEII